MIDPTMKGVQGKAAFTATAYSGEKNQPVVWDLDIQALQIVFRSAKDGNHGRTHIPGVLAIFRATSRPGFNG